MLKGVLSYTGPRYNGNWLYDDNECWPHFNIKGIFPGLGIPIWSWDHCETILLEIYKC